MAASVKSRPAQVGAKWTDGNTVTVEHPLVLHHVTRLRNKATSPEDFRYLVTRLAVPVRAGDRVVGALAVDAKPAYSFSENDRYQLGILTSFVAVALANARLIEELKEQATDHSQEAMEEVEPLPSPERDSISVAEISEVRRLAQELQSLAEAA